MTEHDYIRSMFDTVNISISQLSTQISVLTSEVSKQKGATDAFREEVLRHFTSCPVEDLREHTGQIDIELERLKTKKHSPDSSDKISKIPSPATREKTIQLLIVLAIVALSGGAVAAQLLN